MLAAAEALVSYWVSLLISGRRRRIEPFVWVIGRIKTAHTRHRGYWWNGDSPDEEQFFSFVPRPKRANHPFTALRSATEHESVQPEIGHERLSALSHNELKCLWYPSEDVCLISIYPENFKWPCGMWLRLLTILDFHYTILWPEEFKKTIFIKAII